MAAFDLIDPRSTTVANDFSRTPVQDEATYNALCTEILAYHEGQHLAILRQHLKKAFPNEGPEFIQEVVEEAGGLVSAVSRKLATAYNWQPLRQVQGATNSVQASAPAWFMNSGWSLAMAQADKISFLTGIAAVLFGLVPGERGEPDVGRFWFQALPPNAWWVVPKSQLAHEVDAFIYLRPDTSDATGYGTIVVGITNDWWYWRKLEGFSAYDLRRVLDDTLPEAPSIGVGREGRYPNPYGLIPVEFLRDRAPICAGRFKPAMDEELITAQRSINFKLTGRNFNLNHGGFSTLVVQGPKSGIIAHGPSRPLNIPRDKGTEKNFPPFYLTPDPFTTEFTEAIRDTWQNLAQKYGQDVDVMQGRITSTSGEHQEVKEKGIELNYGQRTGRASELEQRSFSKVKVIAALEPLADFRPGREAELVTVFKPWPKVRDRADRINETATAVSMGLQRVDDLVRLLRPDLRRQEDVDAYLAEVAQRNGSPGALVIIEQLRQAGGRFQVAAPQG